MKKDQIKAGVTLSLLSLLLNTLVSLLYTPFLLYKMGQSEFGLYSLAASVVGYLTILDFGLGHAVVRFTAIYRTLDDKENEYNLNGIFFIVYTCIGIIAAVAGIILYLNAEYMFSEKMTAIEVERIKILFLLMTFNLAVSFPLGIFNSIVVAYEEFVFSKVVSIIKVIISPCIMIPLLIFGYRAIGMVVVATVLNIWLLTINMWYCLTKLKVKVHFGKFDLGLLSEISVFSFYGFLNLIVDRMTWHAGQLILGVVSGTVAVAVYSVAIQLNNYYLEFSTAISWVLLPRLTAMFAKGATDQDFSEMFIKVGRIQYILIGYILGGFLLVGQSFINLWAGPGYERAFLIACFIMIPVTFPLIQNTGIGILQAQNKQRFRSVLFVFIALMNILVSIPLGKRFGGLGCASGIALALILSTVIMNVYYYKKINLNIPRFWKEITIMTIPITIAFCSSFILGKFIGNVGIFAILAKAITYTVVYLPSMWILGMNHYEKNLFYHPLKKMIKK
ncbi:oligosaccharide flippase family protein [Acidaminobacter hydrogenoformans]|uniref:Membrane protein involved in the export of O-antigen and teichoic acid n=1 Tax=Acidaminobacter hydrogenoformans DSM 2784 TaxID=1120920 RepID=A0A1G5RRL4_9FIRM|nr:oligosaccharide flippase family protein [Acidaminobacter hydrogenoformans]SCZ76071.1 Membrane protein involved in the export of O-antigen and teichoic acid [Acidaminobacter hydrogenoformans DSM 2784]